MIYIVRHGETDWNLEGRYAGQTDVPLNGTGIMQAEKIREELKEIKFDKIFSSPLKRAYGTASIISNSDINIDNRIIERYNGRLEGKLKIEVPQVIDFNDPTEIRYGIESILDFRKRIYDFLDDITVNYYNQNILIVTHAGVAIYMKCYFDGEPVDCNYSSYKLKNCEIIKYNND